MNSSKPAVPTLTPAEPRKPNVGCPGIMSVYASRVPSRVERWNVAAEPKFCCMPAKFAPTFKRRDQRARVLAVRALQREAARRERGLAHRRIEHAAHLRVTGVPAAREDRRPCARGCESSRAAPRRCRSARSSACSSPVSGCIARRILRLDADDAARGRLLAHELRELAEQHELHALLARRELERARRARRRSRRRPCCTKRLAMFICTGANGLVRSRSATPASSAVTVPALMSVLSPSIKKHTAPRARDMPPPSCVPLMRPKRT